MKTKIKSLFKKIYLYFKAIHFFEFAFYVIPITICWCLLHLPSLILLMVICSIGSAYMNTWDIEEYKIKIKEIENEKRKD